MLAQLRAAGAVVDERIETMPERSGGSAGSRILRVVGSNCGNRPPGRSRGQRPRHAGLACRRDPSSTSSDCRSTSGGSRTRWRRLGRAARRWRHSRAPRSNPPTSKIRSTCTPRRTHRGGPSAASHLPTRASRGVEATDRGGSGRPHARNEGRSLQHLLPIRHGRMVASPFAFYRGAAAIMAADLAGTPLDRLHGPGLWRLPPAQLRRVRNARAADHVRHQRLR